jgi:hypothetical protein
MTDQANYMRAMNNVADAIGTFNGKEVLDRIRESEHATEADLIEFAEVFLGGKYREQKEGAFARLFERMLREGGGVIAQEVEAAEKEATERRAKALSEAMSDDGSFDRVFESFFGPGAGSIFGGDGESTPSLAVNSTQPRKTKVARRATPSGTYRRRLRS